MTLDTLCNTCNKSVSYENSIEFNLYIYIGNYALNLIIKDQ